MEHGDLCPGRSSPWARPESWEMLPSTLAFAQVSLGWPHTTHRALAHAKRQKSNFDVATNEFYDPG
ncbi:hypothetical protein H8959_021340 [Pygathrix nigripes]